MKPSPSSSASAASSGPGVDISQLRRDGLAERSFPGGRNQEFRVFFAPEAHRQAHRHAEEDTSVEICGVLVGQWGADADGPFVAVDAVIRGQAAASKNVEVTFTHETWNRINHEMDSRFADRRIVGWYHTHPDFGIFLSSRDQFIQEHFFYDPGQIAHVIDPIRRIEGVFIWRNGSPSPIAHYWVGDQLRLGASASADPGSSSLAAVGMDRAPLRAEPLPSSSFSAFAGFGPRALGSMTTLLLAVFGPILGCLIGFWFAVASSNLQVQEMAFRGFIENYFDRIVVHQAMEQELLNLAKDLDQLRTAVRSAEAEAAVAKGDPKKQAASFQEAGERLNSIDNRLVNIIARYSLTESERRTVKDRFRAMMSVVPSDPESAAPSPDRDRDRPKAESQPSPPSKPAADPSAQPKSKS